MPSGRASETRPSEQGWACRSTQQAGVYVGDGMRAFLAAPCKEHEDMRKAAGAQRESRGIAVEPRVRAEIIPVETYFALVSDKGDTERELADGVLEIFAQQHHVGRAEAVVLIAGERRIAV